MNEYLQIKAAADMSTRVKGVAYSGGQMNLGW